MAPPVERAMSYSIPSEKEVSEALLEVLNVSLTVRSQTLLHRLVLVKLRERADRPVVLSEQRLRRIAANLKGVDLIIHCREGARGSQRVRCPVCGTMMEKVKNATLYGWTVSTGKTCPVCHYWTGSRERIPIRYVFTIEKGRYLGERMGQ